MNKSPATLQSKKLRTEKTPAVACTGHGLADRHTTHRLLSLGGDGVWEARDNESLRVPAEQPRSGEVLVYLFAQGLCPHHCRKKQIPGDLQRWGVGTGRKPYKKETVRVCKEMPGSAAHASPANGPATDLPAPPGERAAL